MREVLTAIRSTLVLWIVVALFYPLVVLGVAQLFPYQANGSPIDRQGLPTTDISQAVGSSLVGQSFTSDKYFWGRPSTVNYSSFTRQEYHPDKPENLTQRTGISGASNLAPSNPDLPKQAGKELTRLRASGISQPTADLVYASGSGLDPHISPEAAAAQIDRVAKARSLSRDQIQPLIANNTEGRFLGIFGEPAVNVLRLNLAIDRLGR